MRRRLLLLLILTAIPAAPLRAEPRFTAQIPRASLAEVLDRLSGYYGRLMTAAPGAGEGRRATVDWRDATLGTVTREVAEAFQVTPVTAPDGSIRFRPGTAPRPGVTQTASGVVVTLVEVSRREVRAKSEGAGTTEASRFVRFRLRVRSEDGEPAILLSVQGVRAADGAGRELIPADEKAAAARTPAAESERFPDEVEVDAASSLPDAEVTRIERLEGEVALSRSVSNHRLEFPWQERAEAGGSAGAIQLKLLDARYVLSTFHGRAALTVPRGAVFRADWSAGSPDARPYLRDREGRLHPVRIASAGTVLEPDGSTTYEIDLAPASLPSEPVAVVWDLTVRSPEMQVVPFRFNQVPLPTLSDQPVAASNRTGGTLLLSLRGIAAGAEVAVGLSRQEGRAWGPVRWTTHRVDAGGRIRLDRLAPGSYRVIAQHSPGGSNRYRLRQKDAAPLVIQAGRTVRAELIR
jgi:hypothetical protein